MYAVLKMVKNVPYLGNLCSGTTFEKIPKILIFMENSIIVIENVSEKITVINFVWPPTLNLHISSKYLLLIILSF